MTTEKHEDGRLTSSVDGHFSLRTGIQDRFDLAVARHASFARIREITNLTKRLTSGTVSRRSNLGFGNSETTAEDFVFCRNG